ncbi:MAG: DEAD/DEAH box helicase [Nitrospiraceae bacterium]
MDTNELERLLLEQPVSLLHRLARGRVSRHFRSGKRRLVEMLLRTTAENRPGLISDLTALIEEQARKREAQPPSLPRPQPRREKPARPSPFQRQPKTEEPSHHHEPPVSLHEWLSGIGVPRFSRSVPDPWQIDALAKLVDFDVIVSVPTGSGKTYVAIEATKRAMQDNRTVIYTSPLKALSNTKFTEFSRLFGADQVGILTGDRRENAQAPLLIMTTEILRNLLYDAAGGEIDVRLDTLGLVIMDESQYLADRSAAWCGRRR